MGSLLSRSRKSRVTDEDRAVLQLKQQRDKLNQYTKRLEGQLSRERSVAKRLLSEGKKDKALLLLKKKRYIEKLIERSNQQLNLVEQLIHDVEFAQIEVDVFNGLRAGNEALTKIHQMMKLEDVEQILDETREAAEYMREIDAALAGGLTPQDTEAAELELENLLKSTGEQLPSVPTHEISASSEEDHERPRRAKAARTRVVAD